MKMKSTIKRSKFSYVFIISLLRVFSPIILKINVQNYCTKSTSLVDYFLEITEKNMFLFFSVISKNLTYNYNQLINITCVDNINLSNYHINMGRFSLIYILNSINTTSRILVTFSFSLNSIIKSISSIYKASIWLEREIYDLFGVYFFEHHDLRRILTDYGFKGFPLRKIFH
jgi:NADH-quinone oxidoreductase subunit C